MNITSPKNLTGKVALVTGASRGIGAAIAQRLAAEGAAVAITYNSSPAKANEVVRTIEQASGRAIALPADSANAAAIRAAVSKTVETLGRLDIVVNNAGILALGDISQLTEADFDKTINVNVRAVFIATQAAIPHMKEGGRIINIGSTNADRMPFPGGSIYAMSKSALVGLVKGLARDLGPKGITINNIQPGPVATEMNPPDGDFAKVLLPLIAVNRYGHDSEIGALVAFLAGPESGYITGASLTIDGGFSA
jgi:3-oxoacyl-[acyl-carrier protein] reductase